MVWAGQFIILNGRDLHQNDNGPSEYRACLVFNPLLYSGGWNTEHVGWFSNVVQFCSVFQWLGFGMIGTIAIAIAVTDHSKTEPLEI